LKQKQMKKAGDWRVALRVSVLRDLARLGREPRLFQPRSRHPNHASRQGWFADVDGRLGGLAGGAFAGEVPLAELAEAGEATEAGFAEEGRKKDSGELVEDLN